MRINSKIKQKQNIAIIQDFFNNNPFKFYTVDSLSGLVNIHKTLTRIYLRRLAGFGFLTLDKSKPEKYCLKRG